MKGLGMAAIMVIVQVFEVGLSTLMKAAMNNGMSNVVYVVYSNALAIIVLLACSLIYYRKRSLPQLTVSVLFRIFLLGLLSCAVQNFMSFGVKLGSPALASAISDLIPAFTFTFAVISRMEKLDLRVQSSLAKSIGTLISICGALIVTLYKGLPLMSSPLPNVPINEPFSSESNWVIGGLLLSAGCFSLSLLFIVQSWIMKDCPAELLVTLISCVFVVILCGIEGLVLEKDLDAWRLKPDVELIAIGYSAVFAVSARSVIYAWACRKKGPLYVAMFQPLGMVIAVIMGVAFLGDTLYLGSVVGAAILALGFYGVLWGKSQEENADDKSYSSASCSEKLPLLQNENSEIQ